MSVTVAAVASWLRISPPADPSDEHTIMVRLVEATVATARRRLCLYVPEADWADPSTPEIADLPESQLLWPDEIVQACIMQAARLFRRRSTPEGLAEFPDLAVITIRRFDPDIEDQLADFRRFGQA